MGRENVIGIRLTSDERKGLAKAAEAHAVPQSTLSRQIVLDWLRSNGWMGREAMQSPRPTWLPKQARTLDRE